MEQMNKRATQSGSTDQKLFNGQYILLLVYSFLMAVTYYLITPLLTKHINSLGFSLSAAGVLAGSVLITSLIFRPISGALADQFNKKRVLLISGALMCGAIIGLALCQNMALLFLFRMIQGACFSVYTTLVIVMANESVPSSKIGTAIGYFTVSMTVAQAVGPYLGSFLDSQISTSGTFIVAAGFCALSFFILLPLPHRFERTSRPTLKGLSKHLFSVKLIPHMLIIFSFGFGAGLIANFIALSSVANGLSNYSLYFIISTVLIIFIRPLTGKLFDKRGFQVIIIPSFLFGIATMIGISFMNSIWLLCLVAVGSALSHGTASPVVQAQCAKDLPPEMRGLAISSFYLGADVSNGLSSIVGGIVADLWGYSAAYLCGALLYVIFFVYYIIIRKRFASSDASM